MMGLSEQTFKSSEATCRASKPMWLQEQQQNGGSGKEAMDKQRDKFLFEKLFAHFQAEIRRVQDLSDQVRAAAERAADPTSSQGVESTGVILDMENAGAYADADSDSLFISEDPREIAEFDFVSENDALLSVRHAYRLSVLRCSLAFPRPSLLLTSVSSLPWALVSVTCRTAGMGQVALTQANHIFKDLANLIFSQGETLNSIETQMQDAHAHSKAATLELRQASRMQQRSRQRRCFLVLFIAVLVFLILYSLNVFSAFAFLRSSTVSTEPLRVAVVEGEGAPEGPGGVRRKSLLTSSLANGAKRAPSLVEVSSLGATKSSPAPLSPPEGALSGSSVASPVSSDPAQAARETMEAAFRPQVPAP
ncbi:snare domain-containing protein [Cyclospora cayetanensis]|uniref:Snare domain-containing protein n=1 Tax=Cyclospora cayetanensis TaxID=88456 RepID=A0A1D3CV77_9EIME|nr:snare domain-containing protein [Cyclospora cayetanensis]